MNQKVKIGNSGIVTITDKMYKAAGGEASIYVNSGVVYKLYHDPQKKQLPQRKMQELSSIKNDKVVIPQELIFDTQTGNPLGYTTKFVDNAEPLLKLFTRTFKDSAGITYQMINDLVNQLQLTTLDVHAAKCLIVDFNELNVLAELNSSTITPWFIDTDSYATPSFKATAIMDSVRDRKVSVVDSSGVLHYNPTTESDWFSWSILTFCLYTNIHPFRGAHPNYKPAQKKIQMDDGISVFHPGVRVPPSVNDFNVIPPRHLDWYKQVFLKGERGIPPIAGSTIPQLVPTQVVTIKGTDKLSVHEIAAYGETILDIRSIMGIYYVATKKRIYANHKEIGTHAAKSVVICAASDGTPVIAQQDDTDKIIFRDLTKAEPIATATSKKMFVRNNSVYTTSKEKLIENSFITIGNKIIRRMNEVANLSGVSSTIYDGCVIQDLLGKMFLTLPYKQGSCFSKHIPQFDGYRIVGAKAEKQVVVVLGEKNGQIDRLILVYNRDFSEYDFRKVDDVAYDTINFTVMDNGVCILLSNTNEIELFVKASQCETLSNPPFDSTMKLFSTSDGIFIINDNSFHQVKRK